jgi:predicted nucleic acid-binding protein
MIEEIVIDINVFMAALSTADGHQSESVDFLRRVRAAERAGEVRQRQPPMFVLEFFAVRNRIRQKLDRRLYPEIITDPIPTVIEPFTEDDAHALQDLHAARFPCDPPFVKRGGDLEYLAVAVKHGCTLVSLDDGLLEYGRRDFWKVIPPAKWLAPGQHAS